MTILWQDGFDLYNIVADLLMNYSSVGSSAIALTGGRFGGGSWESQDGGHGLVKPISGQTDFWISAAINIAQALTFDAFIFQWGSTSATNSGVECSLTYEPLIGVWKFWRGYAGAGGATVLATIVAPLASGWHWLDVRFKYSATLGEFEFWIDDAQVASLTGQNTIMNSGTNPLVFFCVGDAPGASCITAFWDDLFVYDTGTPRLGDSRIETLLPSSDAGPNDGTPSSGSNHYAVVNEAQWNTSNFITMPNTSGDKEVYGFNPLVSTPANVWNVKVYTVSEKSDAGSFQLEPLVISNGTEADTAGEQLLTSWGTQEGMWALDPHTSASWTYAGVNAITAGYKVP